MLESWTAIIDALTITDWVMVFLITKPAFIISAIVGVWWTRIGREPVKALPADDAPTGLLEADDLPSGSG